MVAPDSRPVVLGSGLTGMAVSDRLSRADVPHVLVGEPPDDQPRLGESLDPAGTLLLLDFYPEFEEFYFKKRGITVFGGEYATVCDFGQTLARFVGLRMLGFQSPPEFIDVDRVGFDQALYEKIVASEYCTRLETLAETVEYDRRTDTVEAVGLRNGETFEPGHVFDCTNFARVLGRSLDVPVEWLGEPQRVVFTDYHASAASGGVSQIDEKWEHADHLVRLYADIDGLDGLAWAIPIGSYVSVGISMPHGQDDLPAERVLERVEDAYRHRGMGFLDLVDDPRPPVDVPRQRYFVHERAYGRNWLLAGAAYGQFWFPTASGVGTSLLAAYLAPESLENPEAGERYQDYVDGLRESHRIFDRMITRDHDEITAELVQSEADRIIAENVKRVARLATMRNGPLASGVARLFMKVASFDGLIQGDCWVNRSAVARQARTVFDRE